MVVSVTLMFRNADCSDPNKIELILPELQGMGMKQGLTFAQDISSAKILYHVNEPPDELWAHYCGPLDYSFDVGGYDNNYMSIVDDIAAHTIEIQW